MPCVQHGQFVSDLILQVLELAIVTQPAELGLPDSGIISASVPYPRDHLSQPNVVGLELVETPHDQQCCDIERPVEELAKAGVFSDREVIGNAAPAIVLDITYHLSIG